MTLDQTINFAVAAIRQFLSERPDSADTLDGIHRWWIRWPYQEESSLCTLSALERLEASGDVEQFRAGCSILWRRKR